MQASQLLAEWIPMVIMAGIAVYAVSRQAVLRRPWPLPPVGGTVTELASITAIVSVIIAAVR